ncbi:MAG TPA: hypothetical protein VGN17_00305 [Bryobacteraceae bacterium]
MKRRFVLNSLKKTIDRAYDMSDCEEEIERVLDIETALWTKRAYRVYLSIDDLPMGSDETSLWRQNSFSPGSHLSWDALQKLKKMVEEAEYERRRRKHEGREIWIKWFTAIAAAIAAATGVFLAWKGRK